MNVQNFFSMFRKRDGESVNQLISESEASTSDFRGAESPKARKPEGAKAREPEPDELLPYLIKPNMLEFKPSKIKVHNTWNRVLMAVGYPRKVTVGFLDRIIRAKGDFDISIHIRPNSIDSMMVKLNNNLKKLSADKFAAESKGTPTPSLDMLIHDTKTLLELLQAGQEKLFDVGLYVNVRDPDEKQLDTLTAKVESDLNSVMIIPRRPDFMMREGLQSIMPTGTDKLNMKRTLTTSALSACFPFTNTFLEQDETGVLLGINSANNAPILKDFFNMANPNMTIIAKSGGGKSYLAKLTLLRMYMSGVKVFVIDPQAEYTDLTNAVEGQTITISKASDTIINIMDLMGSDFDDKRMELLSVFEMLLGSLNPYQKALLDKAITMAYEDKDIYQHDQGSWTNEPPTVEHVQKALQKLARDSKSNRTICEPLAINLNPYVKGAFRFMNKQTKLDFASDFVCFNVKDIPEQVKPVLMFSIMNYVHRKMQEDRSRKMLVVDEAWALLRQKGISEYVLDIVKTCRKFNLSLMILTQEVNDLLRSEAGNSVLANTSIKVLLGQDPSVIDQVVNTFKLNHDEKTLLLSSRVGEGLLIAENDHFPVRIISSKQEDELITTKADVLYARERARKIYKGGKR